MSDGNQIVPLAPAKFYQRSNEESRQPKALRPKRSGKCFFYFLALINSSCKLTSAAVEYLIYGNDPIPSFNMTLAAAVSIKNSNFVRFQFENSSSSVLCEGVVVGEAKLGSGRVGARKTRRVNIAVKISGDFNSGKLKLNSYAKLKGNVRLFGIVKNRTAVMNCGLNLNLTSRSIQDMECI
ncbi:late embryogenesis abundant protein [Salix suchowensis]|nr:late embryogenesis abundant protein [Salix suchowensis]